MRIPRHIYDAIVEHAAADHPVEACGVVAAPKDAGDIARWRWIPMDNVERSESLYRFGPAQQLAAWEDMDSRGECPVVIYHSHTSTEAYPSRIDIDCATYPGVHYVIVSTRDLSLRSFRIVGGEVSEEPVDIEPAG